MDSTTRIETADLTTAPRITWSRPLHYSEDVADEVRWWTDFDFDDRRSWHFGNRDGDEYVALIDEDGCTVGVLSVDHDGEDLIIVEVDFEHRGVPLLEAFNHHVRSFQNGGAA